VKSKEKVEFRERARERARKRKREEAIERERYENDFLLLQKKVKKLEREVKRLNEILKTKCDEVKMIEEIMVRECESECALFDDDENVEVLDKSKSVKLDEKMKEFMAKSNCVYLTKLEHEEFDTLLTNITPIMHTYTLRGTKRKNMFTLQPQSYSISFALFLTLFWLSHYPTIRFLSVFFKIHDKTVSQILKRTCTALSEHLKNEIEWPPPNEMNALRFTFQQAFALGNIVCAVDGTEIQISRPSNPEQQKATYSVKKKQNSLNVLLVSKLNGEIIYFSPTHVGPHDQAHWNETDLRSRFLHQTFGIVGDGGFFFNRKSDDELIVAAKPFAKPKHGTLTQEQKDFNTKLSRMRVVIENTIRRLKTWRIFRLTYRHWRDGKGVMNIDEILTIIVALTNRSIRKNPPRAPDWVHPDWHDLLAEHAPQVHT